MQKVGCRKDCVEGAVDQYAALNFDESQHGTRYMQVELTIGTRAVARNVMQDD